MRCRKRQGQDAMAVAMAVIEEVAKVVVAASAVGEAVVVQVARAEAGRPTVSLCLLGWRGHR